MWEELLAALTRPLGVQNSDGEADDKVEDHERPIERAQPAVDVAQRGVVLDAQLGLGGHSGQDEAEGGKVAEDKETKE